MRATKTAKAKLAQLKMFADHVPAEAAATADPDRVRRKLAALLAEARKGSAQELPGARRRLIETVVPQMTRWLPEDEAERIKKVFWRGTGGLKRGSAGVMPTLPAIAHFGVRRQA